MSEQVEAKRRLLNMLWVIDGATLRRWNRFPPFEEIQGSLVHPSADSPPCFISHRWETAAAPDPHNLQYAPFSAQIDTKTYYWYDYTCVPQRQTSQEAILYLQYILENLNEIVMSSELLIACQVSNARSASEAGGCWAVSDSVARIAIAAYS